MLRYHSFPCCHVPHQCLHKQYHQKWAFLFFSVIISFVLFYKNAENFQEVGPTNCRWCKRSCYECRIWRECHFFAGQNIECMQVSVGECSEIYFSTFEVDPVNYETFPFLSVQQSVVVTIRLIPRIATVTFCFMIGVPPIVFDRKVGLVMREVQGCRALIKPI